MTNPTFTPSQQAVIAHGPGAALVFAGAGSGKTTTMVHRIARLVREGVPPSQILATSFNRAAADEIGHSLHSLGVKGVQSRTLHSLGYSILAQAVKEGALGLDLSKARVGVADLDRYLLNRVLVDARKRRLPFADELNRLDTDDFLDFLSRCKGNLVYADLASRGLPRKSPATQAVAPAETPWYLDLYQRYEETRQGLGWLTFDDLLLTAWELLIAQPRLRKQIQSRYQYVLVDEFQDVNLAQAEIVDLIARPHGNLMVIGDDDQTIYEWRGAAPRFILDFQRRYRATPYLLQENFRCRPSQIELANQIIRHNRERAPKQLLPTRAPGGSTTLASHPDQFAQAQAIVAQIQQAQSQGLSLDSVAVLVRLYAQTAPIEAALLNAGIAYTVAGDLPFPQRPEAAVLFDYLTVGQLEGKLLAGKSLTSGEKELLNATWAQIVNRPLRYIARSFWRQCLSAALQQGTPLSRSMADVAPQAPQGVDRRMVGLGEDLAWLARLMDQTSDAGHLLSTLVARLGYGDALSKEGGGEALVQARLAGLSAFLDLPQPGESWQAFRQRCQQMGPPASGHPSVTLTTIFRAKGLEWPMVIVPDCNQGMIPYQKSDEEDREASKLSSSSLSSTNIFSKNISSTNIEEERRLLYVAVTRSREHLCLHALNTRPLSLFLEQAGLKPTRAPLAQTSRIQTPGIQPGIKTSRTRPAQTKRRPAPNPQSPVPGGPPQPFSRTRQNTQEIWDGMRGIAELIGRLWKR